VQDVQSNLKSTYRYLDKQKNMKTSNFLDNEIATNIYTASLVSQCIILVGKRQFDRFLIADEKGKEQIQSLERICQKQFGSYASWNYDPSNQQVILGYTKRPLHIKTSLPKKESDVENMSFDKVISAFTEIKTDDSTQKFSLLVDASLLLSEPKSPHDKEFKFVQYLEFFTRKTAQSKIIFLRINQLSELPTIITTAPQVKVVHIPSATQDVRHSYSRIRCKAIAENNNLDINSVTDSLTNITENWTLDQLEALIQTSQHQNIKNINDIEELARAIRIGTTYSPWSGLRIRSAIGNANETLSKRVIGQSHAVDTVVSALRKSTVGLSGAYQTKESQTPKAVFFFAGPTGTGKTELAKSISQLIFGQESLLRFDCGELRQEHAVARLIGAPPGYVGFDKGGELTEGIRAKPNSVVLFDEIEKAHPRLLDTLLGVLDDGRLTSGQGETSFFGQAILIFTSNLGMYESVSNTNGQTYQRARFTYDTSYKKIQDGVREAIWEEFTTGLGRPELIGRLGGKKSIIVFDFLRDLERICDKFVKNISIKCKRIHNLKLKVDDSIIKKITDTTISSPDALVLGGRGLLPALDLWLTNPLADFLFEQPQMSGTLEVKLLNDKTKINYCE